MLERGMIASALLAMTSIAALAMPVAGVAHVDSTKLSRATAAAPHYALIDLGTPGGPNAELDGPAVQITSQGAVLGAADTGAADGDYPNFNPFLGGPDPLLKHAFIWQHGVLTDLGALSGNNSSAIFEMNGSGVGAGASETGSLDPLTGFPAEHAVLFHNGLVIDLGTLPGGIESQALAINDHGQVAGFSSNATPDPTSVFGWGTQTRSFIWQNGAMHDLGTLGGPDAVAATLNSQGQIAGDSYTNDTANPTTGAPTTHPFLWTNGHMRDLGTLGGTSSATAWLNDKGEVVGQDNLAGDQTFHPFLWDGTRLRDLGTLGGNNGDALHVNNAGAVTGWAYTAGDTTAHTFLWNNGAMTDLTGANSPQCTFPEWLNNHNQVVGGTCDGTEALLWANGHQYDINSLVGPTDVQLTEAAFINDPGQITTLGTLPNGDQHVFLLKPS